MAVWSGTQRTKIWSHVTSFFCGVLIWWLVIFQLNSLVQTQPSADPRCPFKQPLFFFNWSPGCSPPPFPSAHQAANQMSPYLRPESPGPLVSRCEPGRRLGQTSRREGQMLILLPVQIPRLWLVEDKVEADLGSALTQKGGNWSQNHRTATGGGCGHTWRSGSAQVVECRGEKQGDAQQNHKEKSVCLRLTGAVLLIQSSLRGKPTRSLSTRQVSSSSSPPPPLSTCTKQLKE